MARDRAREALDAIRDGRDPVEERRAAKRALAAERRRLTFRQAAEAHAKAKLDGLVERSRKQWIAVFERMLTRRSADMMVDEIGVQEVLRVLEPVWSKPPTATKLRAQIEAVLSWAKVAGHRTGENPARWKGNLDHMLASPSKVAKSDRPTRGRRRRGSGLVCGARKERGGTSARASNSWP